MTEPVVIDASAGVELVLNTPTGDALRELIPRPAEEWAPDVYAAEVASVLRRAELAGRVTPQRAAIAITRERPGPRARR